jgi:cytochrome c-type biogenesis protein
MENVVGQISSLIQGNPALAFFAVFAGGLISAASPCVLAAIPLAIGYVGGYSGGDKKRALFYSLLFVLGISITFTLLGIAASAMGSLLARYGIWFYIVLSAVVVAMGLSLLGLYKFPSLIRTSMMPRTRGAIGAFIMGLLVGAASSPCATPVLAVVLAYAASEGSMAYGGALLFVYAVGHCMLILAAGVSVGFVNRFINSKGLTASTGYLKKTSGALLVGAGGYVAITQLF